ncbi:hypothetical protein Hamer_G011628 [Homarus americanus]|uniref:Uncharacterized protein n=1 Tax=Homarus americanus TaxID=6706 RepID=A0A8J5K230_HOMAM|nr:hypothetical protein Hamer_G011628 [Homarus americanus]
MSRYRLVLLTARIKQTSLTKRLENHQLWISVINPLKYNYHVSSLQALSWVLVSESEGASDRLYPIVIYSTGAQGQTNGLQVVNVTHLGFGTSSFYHQDFFNIASSKSVSE